jgi:hypothetical protein
MSGKHGSKGKNSKWQVSIQGDPDDPNSTTINWKKAAEAVKPFEEFEARRNTLLATIKKNVANGKKIMADPEIKKYQQHMKDLNHNFREFAKREATQGRFFKQWLEAAGLTGEYHKLFQIQKALASSQFDGVRSQIAKANVCFDAVRTAQAELDGLHTPEGGDDPVSVSASDDAVYSDVSNLEN